MEEKREKEKKEKKEKKESGKKGRSNRKRILFLGIAALVMLLNVAAWNSTAFCDWYIANIFPIWVGTYGRLTGIFPFSVGEWLIGAGVALVALALLLGLSWGCIGLVSIAGRLLKAAGHRMPQDCQIYDRTHEFQSRETYGEVRWGKGL